MNEGPIDLALLYNMEGNINISKIPGQCESYLSDVPEHWSSKSKPISRMCPLKKLRAEANKRCAVPELSLISKCLLIT